MNLVKELGTSGLRDAFHEAFAIAHSSRAGREGIIGYGVAHLLDGDGKTKLLVPFGNLITDAGDLYEATKVVVGIGPSGPAAPTAANGMKVGTGSTAPAKSGAGAALVTYTAGTNVSFDTGYATVSNLGAGLGVNAVYRSTWGPGVGTATLTECVIVNDAGTNATSTAANTYSRSLFSPSVPKGSSDTLQALWNWKLLGA